MAWFKLFGALYGYNNVSLIIRSNPLMRVEMLESRLNYFGVHCVGKDIEMKKHRQRMQEDKMMTCLAIVSLNDYYNWWVQMRVIWLPISRSVADDEAQVLRMTSISFPYTPRRNKLFIKTLFFLLPFASKSLRLQAGGNVRRFFVHFSINHYT